MEWISVKKALPASGQIVLVWSVKPWPITALCERIGDFVLWSSRPGYFQVSEVTHWMPLPEVPGPA